MKYFRNVCVMALVAATISSGTALAADRFWGGYRMWDIKAVPGKLVIQVDTVDESSTATSLVVRHPAILSDTPPLSLGRGFYKFNLVPGVPNAEADAALRTDPAIRRINPVYVPLAGKAERIPLDFVSVQFRGEAAPEYLEGILAAHGVHRADSSLFVHNLWLCQLDDTTQADPVDVGNALHEEKDVVWACASFYGGYARTQLPNDPYFPAQYYLQNTGQFGGTEGVDIDADSAWEVVLVDSTVKVAIIDDGITSHPDLEANRLLQGFDAVGYWAPSRQYDFFPAPGDSQFHGMACAGILAAAHNDTGIAGVMGSCQIVPVKVFDDFGNPAVTPWDVGQGIYFAAIAGAKVISISGGYIDSVSNAEVFSAIKYATDPTHPDRDYPSVVVVSSGNFADSAVNECNPAPYIYPDVCFPANMDEVISVGAIRNTGWLWPYSCFGSKLDVVAPSGDVLEVGTTGNVCSIGNAWTVDQEGDKGWNPTYSGALGDLTDRSYTKFFGGTSAACPQVAGIAALILARSPWLADDYVYVPGAKLDDPDSIHVVNWIIQNSAVDIYLTGRDDYTGWGRANAYRALLSVMRGDLDNNGFIDATDVAFLIDIVHFGGSAPFDMALGDLVCDGQVDATDLSYLIDYAMFGGAAPELCFEYDY